MLHVPLTNATHTSPPSKVTLILELFHICEQQVSTKFSVVIPLNIILFYSGKYLGVASEISHQTLTPIIMIVPNCNRIIDTKLE